MFSITASLPTISEQPSNVTVNFYESVSLNCTAYGFGVLKVFWKRVKHPMPVMTEVTEKESLNKITSILKITKTTGYYSGQYYCVAKNEVGEVVSKIANLYVQGNAKCYDPLIRLRTYVLHKLCITYIHMYVRTYVYN